MEVPFRGEATMSPGDLHSDIATSLRSLPLSPENRADIARLVRKLSERQAQRFGDMVQAIVYGGESVQSKIEQKQPIIQLLLGGLGWVVLGADSKSPVSTGFDGTLEKAPCWTLGKPTETTWHEARVGVDGACSVCMRGATAQDLGALCEHVLAAVLSDEDGRLAEQFV
jgi:hypothetical protein